MGSAGELLLLVVVLMAITSTGSAEVIAISSVVVYDIYQTYIQPYRKVEDVNTCVLCGRPRGRKASPGKRCRCVSMKTCPICKADNKANEKGKMFEPVYKCLMHGSYREYTDYLINIKNWSLLWTTLAIIPLTLILSLGNVTIIGLYSIFLVCAVSTVIPVVLCIFWARLNAAGMISGALGGLVLGLATRLGMAAQTPNGWQNFFFLSTMESILVALFGGGLITIVVTWVTNRNFTDLQAFETWERTRDIDNPLSPWAELYARELKLSGANELDSRPSLQEVTKACTSARMSAYFVSPILVLIIVIIWPAAMQAVGVFDLATFTHWINVAEAWGIMAAIFIVVFPIISEVIDIRAAWKKRKFDSQFATGPLKLHHASHQKNHGAKLKSMLSSKQLKNPASSTDLYQRTRV